MSAIDLNNPGYANMLSPQFNSCGSLSDVTLAATAANPCVLTATADGSLLVNGNSVVQAVGNVTTPLQAVGIPTVATVTPAEPFPAGLYHVSVTHAPIVLVFTTASESIR